MYAYIVYIHFLIRQFQILVTDAMASECYNRHIQKFVMRIGRWQRRVPFLCMCTYVWMDSEIKSIDDLYEKNMIFGRCEKKAVWCWLRLQNNGDFKARMTWKTHSCDMHACLENFLQPDDGIKWNYLYKDENGSCKVPYAAI